MASLYEPEEVMVTLKADLEEIQEIEVKINKETTVKDVKGHVEMESGLPSDFFELELEGIALTESSLVLSELGISRKDKFKLKFDPLWETFISACARSDNQETKARLDFHIKELSAGDKLFVASFIAARKSNSKLLFGTLVEESIDIKRKSHLCGRNLLHMAVVGGCENTVANILMNGGGILVDMVDAFGTTPLGLALKRNCCRNIIDILTGYRLLRLKRNKTSPCGHGVSLSNPRSRTVSDDIKEVNKDTSGSDCLGVNLSVDSSKRRLELQGLKLDKNLLQSGNADLIFSGTLHHNLSTKGIDVLEKVKVEDMRSSKEYDEDSREEGGKNEQNFEERLTESITESIQAEVAGRKPLDASNNNMDVISTNYLNHRTETKIVGICPIDGNGFKLEESLNEHSTNNVEMGNKMDDIFSDIDTSYLEKADNVITRSNEDVSKTDDEGFGTDRSSCDGTISADEEPRTINGEDMSERPYQKSNEVIRNENGFSKGEPNMGGAKYYKVRHDEESNKITKEMDSEMYSDKNGMDRNLNLKQTEIDNASYRELSVSVKSVRGRSMDRKDRKRTGSMVSRTTDNSVKATDNYSDFQENTEKAFSSKTETASTSSEIRNTDGQRNGAPREKCKEGNSKLCESFEMILESKDESSDTDSSEDEIHGRDGDLNGLSEQNDSDTNSKRRESFEIILEAKDESSDTNSSDDEIRDSNGNLNGFSEQNDTERKSLQITSDSIDGTSVPNKRYQAMEIPRACQRYGRIVKSQSFDVDGGGTREDILSEEGEEKDQSSLLSRSAPSYLSQASLLFRRRREPGNAGQRHFKKPSSSLSVAVREGEDDVFESIKPLGFQDGNNTNEREFPRIRKKGVYSSSLDKNSEKNKGCETFSSTAQVQSALIPRPPSGPPGNRKTSRARRPLSLGARPEQKEQIIDSLRRNSADGELPLQKCREEQPFFSATPPSSSKLPNRRYMSQTLAARRRSVSILSVKREQVQIQRTSPISRPRSKSSPPSPDQLMKARPRPRHLSCSSTEEDWEVPADESRMTSHERRIRKVSFDVNATDITPKTRRTSLLMRRNLTFDEWLSEKKDQLARDRERKDKSADFESNPFARRLSKSISYEQWREQKAAEAEELRKMSFSQLGNVATESRPQTSVPYRTWLQKKDEEALERERKLLDEAVARNESVRKRRENDLQRLLRRLSRDERPRKNSMQF